MIDLDELKKRDPQIYSVFMAMTQICLSIRANGGKRKEYLEMCAHIWNMMMACDIQDLEKTAKEKIERDIEEMKLKIRNE